MPGHLKAIVSFLIKTEGKFYKIYQLSSQIRLVTLTFFNNTSLPNLPELCEIHQIVVGMLSQKMIIQKLLVLTIANVCNCLLFFGIFLQTTRPVFLSKWQLISHFQTRPVKLADHCAFIDNSTRKLCDFGKQVTNNCT